MASNPGRVALERKRKALERKHGKPCVVLIASNGEAAILSKEYVDACKMGRYDLVKTNS